MFIERHSSPARPNAAQHDSLWLEKSVGQLQVIARLLCLHEIKKEVKVSVARLSIATREIGYISFFDFDLPCDKPKIKQKSKIEGLCTSTNILYKLYFDEHCNFENVVANPSLYCFPKQSLAATWGFQESLQVCLKFSF